MKIDFLVKEESNTRLILIFTGWSFGPETGMDLHIHGWDVAVVHDYSSLESDFPELDGYYTIYLFAWSLGIFAAALTMPAERITAAYAVNGTLRPVDDSLGIPEAIFRGTADGLNPRNLKKFRRRMAADAEEFRMLEEMNPDLYEDENVEKIKSQLYHFLEKSRERVSALPWVRAYISEKDLIFPPENQRKAWGQDPEVEIVPLAGAHYVDIRHIIRSTIADTEKVSRRFAKASFTYDTSAIAQYSAVVKLASMLSNRNPRKNGNILEIGCGTGLFTHEYAPLLQPDEATFVDITETGPFGIAEREEYVCADAENWISGEERKWDAILSTSAIQWFANIPRFLHECALHLREGGLIAISTFAPGNMEELDRMRPTPLRYPKSEEIREWLARDFDDIEVAEDVIKVEFRSHREMLMHLKHTGVAGSAPSDSTAGRNVAISDVKSLTYRPIYFIAKKREWLL